MKKKHLFLSFLLLFILFFGIQSKAQSQENFTYANNDFAINFYNELRTQKEDSENLIFSPLSLSSALLLAYMGAKSTTATQFEKLLRFKNTTAFHQKYATFLHDLEIDNGATSLKIANAVWLQKDFPLIDAYHNMLENSYKNKVQMVDFENDAASAEKAINTWVSQQTKGKITQIVPSGKLDALTRLILTNALYFNANWINKFEEALTKDDIFFTPKKEVKTPFMYVKGDFFYKEMDSFVSIILLFKDMQYMTIVMPKAQYTLQDVEKQITTQSYSSTFLQKTDDLLAEKLSFKSTTITIYLPRFKMSKNMDMKDILVKMGLKHAFDVESLADFSGITGDKSIKIDDIVQNTYLEVNENGVEAAAATAIFFKGRGLSKENILKINRPFMFFICDGNTGSILFQGRFVNPEEN